MSRALPSRLLIGLCPAEPACGPLISNSRLCEPEPRFGDGIATAAPRGLADGDAWRYAVAGDSDDSCALTATHDDRGWPPRRLRTSDELAQQPAMIWPDEEPEYGHAESEGILVGGDAAGAHVFSSTALAERAGGESEPMALHAYASDPWPGPATATAGPPHSPLWSTLEDTTRVHAAEPAEATLAECPDGDEPDDDEPSCTFGDVVLGAWSRE